MVIRRAINYAFENSLFLIGGAVAGLLWANIGPESYGKLRDFGVVCARSAAFHGEAGRSCLSLHYLVNDVLMAFFFALAGKEVWEAMLPGGHLRHFRQAAVPIVCAIGGMVAPAAVYVAGAALMGTLPAVGRGWAIPCATDIAFSYMIARLVFGASHPATPFLLLLAITDDALGLIVIALFYPRAPVVPAWLLLAVGAVLLGFSMRRLRVRSFWWYLVGPGVLSWAGFALSGLHPALGFLPVIVTLPHARAAATKVHWSVTGKRDPLDHFEAAWKRPVEVILGLFGLLNAGVLVSAFGGTTYLVLAGLVAGKPLGILASGLVAVFVLRLRLPQGVGWRELVVIGTAAGIGFTVALFVATVAFDPGPLQDAARMGALASGVAAPIAVLAAKAMGVQRAGPGGAEV